jgi:hypothetical protein
MYLLRYVLNCEQHFPFFIFQPGLTVTGLARVYCIPYEIHLYHLACLEGAGSSANTSNLYVGGTQKVSASATSRKEYFVAFIRLYMKIPENSSRLLHEVFVACVLHDHSITAEPWRALPIVSTPGTRYVSSWQITLLWSMLRLLKQNIPTETTGATMERLRFLLVLAEGL